MAPILSGFGEAIGLQRQDDRDGTSQQRRATLFPHEVQGYSPDQTIILG